ncbi:MAG: hypothetical protein QY325_03580 [Flavobacteriales bacterium]|nr:MAG: hypothetical protein QY325_03580 [Flavobacteriales bacterium]
MLPRAKPEPKPRLRDRHLRAYPYPYTAWLALSSDPDNTTIADWTELNATIWQELGLPFGDTVFLRSYNRNLPDQVDAHRHPEILQAHPHDTLHTWGDYMWAGAKAFDRADAEEALAMMRRLGLQPRVWVDHSMFPGNMLHNSRQGSFPRIVDASGHVYPNPLYTLDLVRQAGIRYLWDGTITPVLGQDRPLSRWKVHRAHGRQLTRSVSNYTKYMVSKALGVGTGFRAQFRDNAAYRPHRFPDGSMLYTFQRHGTWEEADIDGLGRLLSGERLDQLARHGGTCILYTHLGKRRVYRVGEPRHIPEHSMASLRGLAERWHKGRIQLSSVSHLLDYLVLRDHVRVDHEARTVSFVPDGIAFERIDAAALRGHRFTLRGINPGQVTVQGPDGPLQPRIDAHAHGWFTLDFS